MSSGEAGLLDELARKARAIGHPLRAVGLEWAYPDDDDDDDEDSVNDRLDLCAFVEAVGWMDSRYQAVKLATLPAAGEPEQNAAAALARALADRLGVETPPSVPGYWLTRQPRPPAIDFDVTWEAFISLDDGAEEARTGTERVRADAGRQAVASARDLVLDRLDSKRRPVRVRVVLPQFADAPEWASLWFYLQPDYPAGAPPPDEIHAARRAGETPARILTRLHGTPLSYMLLFEQSFDFPLADLRVIAGWCRGEVSDDDLDAALEPRIDATKFRWNRPFVLREARRAGRSPAAIIRADSAQGERLLELILSLRKAFPGIGLGDANGIVSAARDTPDATLDAELEAAIARSAKR